MAVSFPRNGVAKQSDNLLKRIETVMNIDSWGIIKAVQTWDERREVEDCKDEEFLRFKEQVKYYKPWGRRTKYSNKFTADEANISTEHNAWRHIFLFRI